MNYPKKLLSLRGLQGGQFGALDVTAVSDALIELDFGPDFDRFSPSAARILVGALTRRLDQLPADACGDHDTSILNQAAQMHIVNKTQSPQGYCVRTSRPVPQTNERNSSRDAVDTEAMTVKPPLTAGVRVRIKQPSTDLANEDGVVTRIDARGALLKLDSGRELLVEPEMLEVLA